MLVPPPPRPLCAAQLGIEVNTVGRLGVWEYLAVAVDEIETEVNIAVVGKYTGLQDSYLSVIKSLRHAAVAVKRKLKITWMEAENLEEATMHKSPDRCELGACRRGRR